MQRTAAHNVITKCVRKDAVHPETHLQDMTNFHFEERQNDEERNSITFATLNGTINIYFAIKTIFNHISISQSICLLFLQFVAHIAEL